jgi:tetratricopeptide (TPR) repeat protein
MNHLSIDQLQKQLEINPENLIANKQLGAIFVQQLKFSESVKYFSKAVTIEQNADNFYNLGVVLQHLKSYQEAEMMYLEAIKHDPLRSEIYSNLGAIYRDVQNFNQSLICYQKCIELAPDNLIEYSNYVVVLLNLKKYEDALLIIDYVILKSNNCEKFILQKYEILIILGMEKEADDLFTFLLNLYPDSLEVRWINANRLLSSGNYLEGWREYESRWFVESAGLRPPLFDKPKWMGDFSIKGKTLLIYAEQGLGDTIQFSRFIPKLSSTRANLIFALPKTLKELHRHLDKFCRLIENASSLPHFDAHVPLMSLPMIFGCTLDNIPNDAPYIFADPSKCLIWKQNLKNDSKFKVGLVWSGGHRADQPNLFSLNDRRNMPVEFLTYLKDIDASFYSLQIGEPAETEFKQYLARDWKGPPIHNLVSQLNDFSDTAALISNLDLVISVDTSTAHLAAAMGKPVWLLNRLDSCWRWLRYTDKSPWYPSIKIYRQSSVNGWPEVMSSVRNDLLELTANKYVS